MSPALAAFLQGYERACPLKLPSNLSDPQLMRAILEESAGITDTMVKSLQAAALVAMRSGIERITPDLLTWWRDPPLLSTYDCGAIVPCGFGVR